MRGHSRPKDGVATLAYDPRIHDEVAASETLRLHLQQPHHGLPGQARQ
jgi:hypothetical protein